MLQDEDIYMNRAYFRILRNLFMQTDEVDQRTQSMRKKKGPQEKGGETCGPRYTPSRGELSYVCVFSYDVRTFIAWTNRLEKITWPELCECLLLEKLIGRYSDKLEKQGQNTQKRQKTENIGAGGHKHV